MMDLPAVCNAVSSAKIEHWLWEDAGRSLIKIRKSTRPRTVPCGIPDFGDSGAEVVPSKRTYCSLCVRKLANHSVSDELNPIKESWLNSPGNSLSAGIPLETDELFDPACKRKELCWKVLTCSAALFSRYPCAFGANWTLSML